MRRGVLAALWVTAAAWFVPGTLDTLEGIDEGHLVYFASRVAEGALPYRDFHHMYGPSVFFLNGALLALAGQDLLAVRIGLIALKATLAVAVARVAFGAAGLAAGLLAWLLLLGVWGAPLWIFAAPYASVYQVTLDVLALVALIALPERSRRRAIVAGLLLGLAATFKQTSGVLVGVGVLAFLFHEGSEQGSGRRDPLATSIRLALLAIGLAVVAAYAASFSEPRAVVILGGPLVALVLWVGVRCVRDGSRGRDDLVTVAWTVGAAALAPAAYLAYYAARGAAGALVNDTLWGLPQKVAVIVPLPPFTGSSVTEGAIAALVLAAVELGRRGAGSVGLRRLGYFGAAAGVLAVLGAVAGGPRALLDEGGWQATSSPTTLSWLPVAIAWLAVARLLWVRRLPAPVVAPIFMAAAFLPGLQPIGDLPHVLIALPPFLPPLAALCARYANRDWPGRWLAAATICLLGAALVAPFTRSFPRSVAQLRAPGPRYERATGVRDPSPFSEDLRELVRYLERTPAETRVLVLPDTCIIHFLAGRRSALDTEDFPLILGTYSHVSDDDARALFDEDAVIARLRREPVLVVLVHDGPGLTAVRRVFPKLVAFVDEHFRQVARFGPYEVLAPADGSE